MGDILSKRSIMVGAVAGLLGGLFIIWVGEPETAIPIGLVAWVVIAFAYEGASMKDEEDESEEREERGGGR